MEVGELADATHKGDMGFLDADTFSFVRGVGRYRVITMEGIEQFSWGGAKVGAAPSPIARSAGKNICENCD